VLAFATMRVAAGAATGAACTSTWSRMDTPALSSWQLNDVAAASANSAWAVGSWGSGSLVLHWDGATWSKETLPNLNSGNRLYAVAAVSGEEAWAVGSVPNGANPQTLVLHRVAGAWTRVSSANHNTDINMLQAIDVVAPDDIWAAGRYDAGGETQVLTEHWEGHAWTEVPYNDVGTLDWTNGISAAGPDDVWLAGHATSGSSSGQIGHWEGSGWTAEFAALDVEGIDARTPGDVWAVGEKLGDIGTKTWSRHFDGSDWTVVLGENPGSTASWFTDVSNDDGTGTWAIGGSSGPATAPLFQRWDGAAWRTVSVPKVAAPSDVELTGIASGGGRLFAVGIGTSRPLILSACPIALGTAGSSEAALGALGADVSWVVPWGETDPHRVVDASGFDLFDSGALAEGQTFSYVYGSAGTFAVTDSSSAIGSVGIPVKVSPSTGDVSSRFRITWATLAAPAGAIFDVQVRRPGTTRFKAWKTGTDQLSGSFTPDSGRGAYTFRARTRLVAGGGSEWSPTLRLRVTA
jgi:hypothetical protein